MHTTSKTCNCKATHTCFMIVKMAYTNINRKCCACNVSKMKHYKYSIILECGSVSFGTLKTLRNSGLEINSNQSDIHICKSKLYEFLQFHTIVRTWFYYFVRLISYRTRIILQIKEFLIDSHTYNRSQWQQQLSAEQHSAGSDSV